MRVPVLEGPSVRARPVETPYARQNFDTGLGEVGKGLEQLGQGVAVQEELAARAKQQADSIAGAENEAALQREWTPRVASFLNETKGVGAAEASTKLYQELEDTRRKIGEGIGDARMQEHFRRRTREMFEDVRRRVESHVSQQRQVAAESALVTRKKTAIDEISANFADEATVQEQLSKMVAPIRALQLSQEDGDAKLAALHQEAALVRLDGYLSAGDWKGAEELFTRVGSSLGPKGAHYAKAIQTLRQDRQAEDLAAQFVEASRDPGNRRVDSAKAFAAVDTLDDVKLRDEVRKRLGQRVAVAEHDWNRKVSDAANLALSQYLQGGHNLYAIDSRTKAWLEENAAAEWYKLEQMAAGESSRGRNAPPTPAQTSAMTRLLVDAADHPEKYATMPVEEFNSTWLPLLAPSDRERAGGVLAQMHAANRGKLGALEERMLLQMGREAGIFDPKQNDVSKWTADQAKLFYAAQKQISDRVREFREQNGKAPPIDQVQTWAAEMLLKGKDPDRGILGFGGGTTRLEAEVKGTGFVPSWTADQRAKAREALKAAGARDDDATVDTYLRLKHKLPTLPVQAAPAPEPAARRPAPTVESPTSRALSGAADVRTEGGGY